MIEIGQIGKIKCTQQGSGGIVGTDTGTIDTVAAAIHCDIIGRLGLAIGQPVQPEAGEYIGKILLRHCITKTGDAGKLIVAPDDTAVIQPDHRGGKRCLAATDGLDGVRHALNIAQQLTVPGLARDCIGHEQQQHNRAFSGGKQILIQQQRGQAEAQHDPEIQTESGADQSSELFVHGSLLL